MRRPEPADAAVLAARARRRRRGAIAVSIDGNGRRVACDPYTGAVEAVLECAANLACVGAEPLGLTNCLNFGNPEKPHVAWQLDRRRSTAWPTRCRALGVPGRRRQRLALQRGPATGPIYPTPVVGMVGPLPDAAARRRDRASRRAGHVIALVRPVPARRSPAPSWRSCAASRCPTALPGDRPRAVAQAQDGVRDAVRAGELASAHDVAEGGFLVALAECCLAGNIGARLKFPHAGDGQPNVEGADTGQVPRGSGGVSPRLEFLFGEAVGGFIVSGTREAIERLAEKVPTDVFGVVGGDALRVGELADASLVELRGARDGLAEAFA